MTNTQNKLMKTVTDTKGAAYRLSAELSRGGQGIVYKTDLPQVLIKGFTNKDPQAKKNWRTHIEWLLRQDLANLKLARPLILLEEPRYGYVMELMEGLISLESLLESFIQAADEGKSTQDYLEQGGLRRRIRILCQLARTLNQLHSRGMLYGDLSPSNIFVSNEVEHAETWLIDCDNISIDSHSGLTIHTPDYGAPEVLRGEAMLSSLTDCWSFAVIAYQLLTHNHPFKGDMINNGSPAEEEAALRGERPWINDSKSSENECYANIPVQLLQHSKLAALFHRTFEQGKLEPSERPSMAEWLAALSEVDEHTVQCTNCSGHYLYPLENKSIDDIQCFFCEAPTDKNLVIFSEFIYFPEDKKTDKSPVLSSNWLKTDRRVCLQPNQKQELKRLMPTFSYDQQHSDNICIEYTEKGLGIYPMPEGTLHLQRGEHCKELQKHQGLKSELRNKDNTPFQLHIGNMNDAHIIWQFTW